MNNSTLEMKSLVKTIALTFRGKYMTTKCFKCSSMCILFLFFFCFFFSWKKRADSVLAVDFNIILALAVLEWGMSTLENAFEN